MKANIEYTDKNGKNYFFENDDVIVGVEGNEYNGKIVSIGLWTDNEQAICLNTSRSKTNISPKIIKLDEITYIFKNPFEEAFTTLGEIEDSLLALARKKYEK